eukprot:TRINITY_DN26470_c0_g2_i2.p1 TRINITY_DN26470_c0_g2~~TRINITY_DN26470_c0_g2_i2.p1  ORF type:complete len:717 (-),score=77.12 TRINITY_DN26470_c0_g2_i2:18-2120(-)
MAAALARDDGTFRLWLHPIHGKPHEQLAPCRFDSIDALCDLDDRLMSVNDIAAHVATNELPADAQIVTEVLYNDLGLYVSNHLAQRRLWLPLLFCQAAAHRVVPRSSRRDAAGTLGVIVYMHPPADFAPASEDARIAREAAAGMRGDDAWILLVTRGRRRMRAGEPHLDDSSVFDRSLDMLGVRGAIRTDVTVYDAVTDAAGKSLLGEGSTASVRLVKRRQPVASNTQPAPSVVGDATMYAAKQYGASASETAVLAECSKLIAVQRHPNIARFVGLFRSPTELESLTILEDILKALVHVHSKGIVHRDVKTDNVLMYDGSHKRAVLTDFGIAAHMSEVELLAESCGTPGYVAPEVLRGGSFSRRSDVFSCGVLFYATLLGVMPFSSENQDETLRRNARARLNNSEKYFDDVPQDVTELVQTMLVARPQLRPSSRQALIATSSCIARCSSSVIQAPIDDAAAADACEQGEVCVGESCPTSLPGASQDGEAEEVPALSQRSCTEKTRAATEPQDLESGARAQEKRVDLPHALPTVEGLPTKEGPSDFKEDGGEESVFSGTRMNTSSSIGIVETLGNKRRTPSIISSIGRAMRFSSKTKSEVSSEVSTDHCFGVTPRSPLSSGSSDDVVQKTQRPFVNLNSLLPKSTEEKNGMPLKFLDDNLSESLDRSVSDKTACSTGSSSLSSYIGLKVGAVMQIAKVARS